MGLIAISADSRLLEASIEETVEVLSSLATSARCMLVLRTLERKLPKRHLGPASRRALANPCLYRIDPFQCADS